MMGDWPQQISKPRVLANFRERGARKPHKNSQRYKERPGMLEAHLALIRKLPCCITLKMPAGEAHHLKSGTGERGMGLRSTDKHTVPISHDPHMQAEAAGTRKERQFFLANGVDPHELARALWQASGDFDRMKKIVLAHHESGKAAK